MSLFSLVWSRSREKRVKDARAAFNGVTFRPGDIAVDCGAHVGKISQKLERRGAIVHAFEPNPYAFQELAARFSCAKNVHLYNKGVLDRAGFLIVLSQEL